MRLIDKTRHRIVIVAGILYLPVGSAAADQIGFAVDGT